MTKFRGRNVPISAHRRLVIDLMHFSRKVPCVCVDRRINIAPLVAARARLSPRPAWTAIFMKAFGIVAARTPELRRAYMTFPWGRIYEHARNNAALHPGHQNRPSHREQDRPKGQPENAVREHTANDTDHDDRHRCGQPPRHQEWPENVVDQANWDHISGEEQCVHRSIAIQLQMTTGTNRIAGPI